jgi:hypothetical protein
MQVTGTRIRHEIKIATAELASKKNIFEKSLMVFPDENKPSPKGIATEILSAEHKLSMWQAAQKFYNSTQVFEFQGNQVTLQYAVSVVGGFSRIAAMWKKAAGIVKTDSYSRRYSSSDTATRSKDTETATPTIGKEEAFEEYKKAEKITDELRVIIGRNNGITVDIPWLKDLG